MAYGNSTWLVGNLTRSPELRYTPSGASVANFSIAVNRKFERNGQQVDESSFFDCVAWGTLAENVAATLTKGQRVIVAGRLDQRAWKTPEGENRSKVELSCEAVGADLRFAGNETTSGAAQGQQQRPQTQQQPDYDTEPF